MIYYYEGNNRVELPLDGVHVSARIVNLVAEVQVVHFYVNSFDRNIDCVYEFPIDEGAAVCGFEVELTDQLLVGEVRERKEARAEYNAARARGQTAALLEEEKPDIFKQSLANIRPFSRINVRTTYVTELSVETDTGGAIFVLPTSIAPRYTPYTSRSIPFYRPWCGTCFGRRVLFREEYSRWNGDIDHFPGWQNWNYPIPEYIVNRESPCAFTFTLEAEMSSKILSMESITHTIQSTLENEGKNGICTLYSVTEPMGKDLQITIYQEKPFEPSVQLEFAPDNSGCAMLTLVPEFDLAPEPVEIIFLVDCSGSMEGNRIEAAKKALVLFVHSLPVTCSFNIIKFGSSSKQLFNNKSQPYTQHSLDQAKDFIRKMGADLGGTEILAPLRNIFGSSLAASHKQRQVFVLTDGQVSNTEQVLEICRLNASTSRVFSIGIGDEVSRHLVQGMARAATGTAEFIVGKELTATSQSFVLERKLLNQLKMATLPSVVDIQVDWYGSDIPMAIPVNRSSNALCAHELQDFTVGLNTILCRDCKVGQTYGRKMHSCRPCAYDLCEGCYQARNVRKCEHQLQSFQAPNDSFICDDCQASVSIGTEMFGCRPCNYDLCSRCYSTLNGSAPPPPEYRCSHQLQTFVTPHSSFRCDECQIPMPLNSLALGCRICNFDLCQGCYNRRNSQPASRFFPTGPARPNSMSFQAFAQNNRNSINNWASNPPLNPNAVGSGMVSFPTAAPGVGRDENIYQAPYLPPPLFSGSKFIMYAFFRPNRVPTMSHINLSARTPQGMLNISVPIKKVTSVGKTVHLLAARSLVRDLSEGTSHLHWSRSYYRPTSQFSIFNGWTFSNPQPAFGQDRGTASNLVPRQAQETEVKQELIELGVKYGITSRETSFVAVERWRDGHSGSVLAPPDLPMQAPPQPQNFFQANYSMMAQPQQMQQRMSLGSSGFVGAPPPPTASFGGGMFRMQARKSSASHNFSAFAPPSSSAPSRGDKPKGKQKKESSSPSYTSAPCFDKQEDMDDEQEDMDDDMCAFTMSPTTTTSTTTTASSKRDLYALLSCQQFDGSFNLTPAFAFQVSKSIEELQRYAKDLHLNLDPNVVNESQALQICLAIIFFRVIETNYKSSKPVWEIAAEKTKNWLLSTLEQIFKVNRQRSIVMMNELNARIGIVFGG